MDNSATILVVDDEPDLPELVKQIFRRRIKSGELSFHFAGDGEEALAVLQDGVGIDLILCDINMPRMDGLTLLASLKDVDRELRTVVVSAYGDLPNIRMAMNRGAFDFVTKPIVFEDLQTTINKGLEDLRVLRAALRQRDAAEQAKASLARYFSPNLVKELVENGSVLELGGERRDLTFVFTDLTNFTPLVESSEPNTVVRLLNRYLDQVTRIVFEHGGTVDKIVGDAVHAIFGAPLEQADQASRAVACALEIDRFAEELRKEKESEGISWGLTRIGVHSGPAIVGNFGGESYFDYTAHGDAINTAARLEHANKVLGTRICVSADTTCQIPEFKGRPVGSLVLKGKALGVEVFEPLGDERYASPATQAYVEAYKLLANGDPIAAQAFAALVGAYGEDPLATFHLKRLLAGDRGADIVLSAA